MKSKIIFLATVLACVCAFAVETKIKIVLVGDSTVNDQGGWGYGFKQFVTPDVEVFNTAANGRSSKSFIDEGKWTNALALRGDYYFIQFGHNDEPGKGPTRETDSGHVAHAADDSGNAAPVIGSISLTNAIVVSGHGTNVTGTCTAAPAPAYYWLDNNNNLLQSGGSFSLRRRMKGNAATVKLAICQRQ